MHARSAPLFNFPQSISQSGGFNKKVVTLLPLHTREIWNVLFLASYIATPNKIRVILGGEERILGRQKMEEARGAQRLFPRKTELLSTRT